MEEKYKPYNLAGKYFKLSGWFFLWRPLKVPYEQIFQKALAAGLKPDPGQGMIEKGAMIGKGWIAIKVNDDADQTNPNVTEITGEFKSYEHVGPYSQLGQAFGMVMKENPGIREFYSVYLNNPNEVAPSELKTLICFR